MFPITYQMINEYQCKYKEMAAKLRWTNYFTKYFRGGGKVMQLICRIEKNWYAKKSPKVHSEIVPYVPTASRNGSYWFHYYSTPILA